MVLCHPGIAICAAVSNRSMAAQLLAFRLSACGPSAGLADEAWAILSSRTASSPLGWAESEFPASPIAVTFAARHSCQLCAAAAFASLSVRGCTSSISKWLSRDLQHQCASRSDILNLVKLLDLLSASTVIAADFVAASDGLLDSLLPLHLLHASLAEEVLCLQAPDSL